jgi:hypothetical protein
MKICARNTEFCVFAVHAIRSFVYLLGIFKVEAHEEGRETPVNDTMMICFVFIARENTWAEGPGYCRDPSQKVSYLERDVNRSPNESQFPACPFGSTGVPVLLFAG